MENETRPDTESWEGLVNSNREENLLRGIMETARETGYDLDNPRLLRVIRDFLDFGVKLKQGYGDSGGDGPLTMSQVEELTLRHLKSHRELVLAEILERFSKFEGESQIIEKKKNEYLGLGVKLRIYQRYTSSVVTLLGRIPFTRTALVPSKSEDKAKLNSLGINGYVFPIDEALGLSHLPFKMTVPAMLETAYEACIRYSFEEAEIQLRRRSGIVVNDDTIRAVTNTIGSLVHANDTKNAEELWDRTPPWKFTGRKKKVGHTLFLEVDGAMVHLRTPKDLETGPSPPDDDPDDFADGKFEDEKEKGAGWKENKLGMAFSSDNIFYWNDKHGVRQHRILKRDYIAFIGPCEKFKKYFYLLAINNGYSIYKNTVLISDGAEWIKKMASELFDNVQHILDYFHLSENVHVFVKNIFPNDENKYKSIATGLCDLFIRGRHVEAVTKINSLGKKRIAKSKFNLLRYIEKNINCIDYDVYRNKGFFIGSGAIESANRTVLQRRLKQPGMRWTLSSAQYMVTLMAKERSGVWEKEVGGTAYRHFGAQGSSFDGSFANSLKI
jgi:hypothetical protein